MTRERKKSKLSDQEREREYVKGGRGRRDEVGGSGIYPASSPNAPPDAEIRIEGDLGGPRGRRRPSDDELDFDAHESWGSE